MKGIITRFLMSYPAMSAYEFDHFKQEDAVKERWQGSSLYMICQRRVMYFAEVVPGRDEIVGEIRQRGLGKSLRFCMPFLSGRPYFGTTSEVMTELQFYERDPRREPPYTNIAGFKFFDANNTFLGWLSPERFLYEYLTGGISADVDGDIHDLLRYQVHYIGKVQDQPIWKRLTGHENFQKVLSREFPFIAGEVPAFEVALLFFGIDAVAVISDVATDESGAVVDSSGRLLTEEELTRVFTTDYPSILRDPIVTDAEAYLINFMLPKYNRVLYKTYPRITGGLQGHGFSPIIHQFIPFATLVTEEATIECSIFPLMAVPRG